MSYLYIPVKELKKSDNSVMPMAYVSETFSEWYAGDYYATTATGGMPYGTLIVDNVIDLVTLPYRTPVTYDFGSFTITVERYFNQRVYYLTTDISGVSDRQQVYSTNDYITHAYLMIALSPSKQEVVIGIIFIRTFEGTPPYPIEYDGWSPKFAYTGSEYYEKVVAAFPPKAPYANGGYSDASGTPTGDYDDTSDVISVPSVPSFNLGITSLINVWVPSTTDINNLANYLWSNFDLTDPTKTLSKMFTDPLSYILSLHMLPFTVGSSTPITVTLAGLATTVSMPPATEQFHDIDCGSVTISEYWGNYLDYTYTKIVLCLPFCGQVDLDPDEVMGKTIKVKYRVDVITGAFVCFVYIDGDKVLGQYAGNCAAQIPISAADFSRLNAAVLGVAGAAASAFGSAALGGHGGMLNGASGGLISSIAANAQNAKVRAQHSGGLTGAPGFMGIQKPYLIIHRPRQSVPEEYEKFRGYPSNVTMALSDCEGFTSIREIKLDGLPFTDGELSELKSILEGGVIL